MSLEDRENIRDVYIDMLEVQVADLTRIAEDLNTRLLATEAARIADREYFEAQYEIWKAERAEANREHARELARVRTEIAAMTRDRDEFKLRYEKTEAERLVAFQKHSDQITDMFEQMKMMREQSEQHNKGNK